MAEKWLSQDSEAQEGGITVTSPNSENTCAGPEDWSPTQLEPSSTRKRCKGMTRSGRPCTPWAMEGGLCFFHANPDKASELGQRGGRAKGPTADPDAAEYIARPLNTVGDVTNLLANTINDLRSGRIDSRLANTAGFLASGMLKAFQQGDIEGRLRAMEAVLSSNKTPRKR